MHSETKKIFKTKEQVEKLLSKYPEYRDNDERLVATFWLRQLKASGQEINNMNAMDLLYLYAAGDLLTSADIIVRARAKAQQDKPELRGQKWNDRHGIGEEVRKEIVKV